MVFYVILFGMAQDDFSFEKYGLPLKPEGQNIGNYISNLSPECRVAFYRRRSDMINAKKAVAAKAKAEAQTRALSFIVVDEIALSKDAKNYTPSKDFLNSLENRIKSGKDINTIRTQFFPDIPQESWEKVVHSLRKQLAPSSDHQGVVLEAAKNEHLRILKRRVWSIKSEITRVNKALKRIEKDETLTFTKKEELIADQRLIKERYFKQLCKHEDDLIKLKIKIAETHSYIGTVDEKVKTSAAIHIHTMVPRPPGMNVEKVIEVGD